MVTVVITIWLVICLNSNRFKICNVEIASCCQWALGAWNYVVHAAIQVLIQAWNHWIWNMIWVFSEFIAKILDRWETPRNYSLYPVLGIIQCYLYCSTRREHSSLVCSWISSHLLVLVQYPGPVRDTCTGGKSRFGFTKKVLLRSFSVDSFVERERGILTTKREQLQATCSVRTCTWICISSTPSTYCSTRTSNNEYEYRTIYEY
jgi:hypothetical protein